MKKILSAICILILLLSANAFAKSFSYDFSQDPSDSWSFGVWDQAKEIYWVNTSSGPAENWGDKVPETLQFSLFIANDYTSVFNTYTVSMGMENDADTAAGTPNYGVCLVGGTRTVTDAKNGFTEYSYVFNTPDCTLYPVFNSGITDTSALLNDYTFQFAFINLNTKIENGVATYQDSFGRYHLYNDGYQIAYLDNIKFNESIIPTPKAVPEPCSIAYALVGLMGIAGLKRH